MIDQTYSAEVLRANGGTFSDPETGHTYGPASSITYDIILHTANGDQIVEGVVPANERWDDEIDTRAAKPGTPVGIVYRGNVMLFVIPEKARTTERCDDA